MDRARRLFSFLSFAFTALLFAVGFAACVSSSSGAGGDVADSGFDVSFGDDATGIDATFEAAPESGADAAMNAQDASVDTFVAPEAGHEAGPEAAVDSSVDASPVVEASIDAPPDASSASAVYVDPANGLDTNPGTQTLPFKTLAHAELVLNAPDAGAGQTVYLAQGTYDSTNQTSLWGAFDNPTYVVGESSANVTFSGAYAGEQLIFKNGGGLSGVTFRNTSTSFQVQGGTFTSSDVVLDGLPGFNNIGMSFINGAVATLNTTSITNINPSAGGQDWACLYADNTANVTWHATGNTITAMQQHGNCIFERGAAQLAIDGLVITTFNGFAAVLYDQAQLTLTNSTITAAGPLGSVCSPGGCLGSIYMGGSQTGAPTGTLVLNGTTIANSPGSAVGYTTTSNTGAVNLSFTNSHLDSNAYDGIWIAGNTNPALALQITATGTTFNLNGIAGISSAPMASVSLTGGAVSNNGTGSAVSALAQKPGGVLLLDAASANALTLRGAALASNIGNVLSVAGSATTTVDLGTAASVGGSTFSGVPVGAGVSALNLSALGTASAVGNTWIPGAQGADASGQYTTPTTIVGPTSGPNVTVPMGASVVMQ